ncbi:hypothetical protein ACQKJG_17815 [Priestia megaterium]|uniref:hypothetical protein n=1 Tax=Priestia megaterium TaxID=1404 RepID=UPI003D05DD02
MLAPTNYYQNAHRLDLPISDNVTDVYPGQLFHINDEGEYDYADGTRKAYPTLNSRYNGQGLGLQRERLEGRDNVSRLGAITCLMNNYMIGTDMYDKEASYTHGKPVVASKTKEGVVEPFTEGTHKAQDIVGYVTIVPSDDSEFLHYQS